MGNILVLNMGLKSIRSIVFDYDGYKLGNASEAIATSIMGDRVEQDADEWWIKAIRVMQLALKDACVNKIDYITVTTSASCLVCVDAAGKPLLPAFMVSDKRADNEAHELANSSEFASVREKTQIDAASSLMLPRLMWIKKNMPDVFDKTAYFLSSNDYFVYRLCGAVKTDYFNVSKFHYILDESSYPKSLLRSLGISEAKLPDVKNTGDIAGTLHAEITSELGLTNMPQVVLSSYDAICSFVGSGASAEGETSDVSGTVTVFRTYSKKNHFKENRKIYNITFRQEGAHIVGGSNNMGGGLIEWVKQCFYQREEFPYEMMEREAAQSELGARGLIFLPYLLGERAPIWNDNARGVYFGIERVHTRKDMAKAVFESTAFIDRDMMAAIGKTGVDVGDVRISGGLARIGYVSQIKADVLNRDILVLSEFETTSTGAAMIALTGQGVFTDMKAAADKFVSIRMIIKPNMENHKKYEHMYQLYKDTYSCLEDLFERRMETLANMKSKKEIKIENL